ncbi:MAG TPA: carbohydrate kinase family protein [Anaerolineales bacterium]
MNPTFIIAGHLHRDYLLSPRGNSQIDVPGGNLLYAAAGLGVWKSGVGLLARVGEDYPRDWLRSFKKRGWDTRGVHITADALDLRYFQDIQENQTVQHSDPVACFARLGMPFPKSLLGYQPPNDNNDDLKTSNPASPRPDDIPSDYLNAHIVHLCPLDYVASTRLTSAFRQASVTTLTLDPSGAYMTGKTHYDVRILLGGLTAFLPSEEELRALFWGHTDDLWQMAEALGEYGCEFIVVKRGARGQMLYDSVSKKKWEIPAYPARLMDISGAGDSFCGGFLAGYQETYDPLRAVLYGSVSASLTIEGSGALHALDSLPGLAQARLDSLAGIVRQI